MPRGVVFCGDGALSAVTKDLRKLAAFLQSLSLFGPDTVIRYDDWWEHDGLHFRKGRTDLHELFSLVATPRRLLESMPGDDDVFIGMGPEDESWYIRFHADWDDDDEELVAAYAIALVAELVDGFREQTLPELECDTEELSSQAYFDRICEGACSL